MNYIFGNSPTKKCSSWKFANKHDGETLDVSPAKMRLQVTKQLKMPSELSTLIVFPSVYRVHERKITSSLLPLVIRNTSVFHHALLPPKKRPPSNGWFDHAIKLSPSHHI